MTMKSMKTNFVAGIAGLLLAACGNAPAEQPRQEYQTLKVDTVDRELKTSYSATI